MFKNIFNLIAKLFTRSSSYDASSVDKVSFASESQEGSFKYLAFMAIVFVLAAVPLTVSQVTKSKDLRIKAAGSSVGSKIFCGGSKLCPSGNCQGDIWRECAPCPEGKARAVIEYECGQYSTSECVLDPVDCAD